MPQLCAKGARTRYNDWEDGARGVEVAGEWANARAAVRGRADDESWNCGEWGGERGENAPAVGKSARARYIIIEEAQVRRVVGAKLLWADDR